MTVLRIYVAVFVLMVAVPAVGGDVPRIAGFEPVGDPAWYTPKNVWNAINGAAEIHMDYGFESLLVQKYKRGEAAYDLEIFDQGSAINAFGIFRRECPPEAEVLPIGGEAAVVAPYTCMMWKDGFFVRASAAAGELNRAACAAILEGLAGGLPGEGSRPDGLLGLPRHDRFKGSERYTPRGYLGVGELPHVVHAAYKSNDFETAVLFRVLHKAPERVDGVWRGLKEKWTPFTENDPNVLVRKIPYRGPVIVIKTASGIWGVSPAPSQANGLALKWLKNAIKQLDREGGCPVPTAARK